MITTVVLFAIGSFSVTAISYVLGVVSILLNLGEIIPYFFG